MQIEGCIAVVTGGGGGIGAGIARAVAASGAAGVVVADVDGAAAEAAAAQIGGGGTESFGERIDAGDEADVQRLVRRVEDEFGRIDLFFVNAGIMVAGGIDVVDEEWDRIWRVNVKSHLYAARAAIPGMLERGGGYLVHTASAAGLLTQLGAAPYAVSKHAVVALAEWIAITYGDRGIKVSCLCPQAVQTAMVGPAGNRPQTAGSALTDGILQPSDVGRVVVDAVTAEEFLILPHPQVATYEKRRADDRERWLRGMRRAQAAVSQTMPGGGRA